MFRPAAATAGARGGVDGAAGAAVERAAAVAGGRADGFGINPVPILEILGVGATIFAPSELPLPTLVELLLAFIVGTLLLAAGLSLSMLERFAFKRLNFSRVSAEADVTSTSAFTWALLTNSPCKGSLSKYFTSPTVPSFFPSGKSSLMPTHSPSANLVVPMNLISPFLAKPGPVRTRLPTVRSAGRAAMMTENWTKADQVTFES